MELDHDLIQHQVNTWVPLFVIITIGVYLLERGYPEGAGVWWALTLMVWVVYLSLRDNCFSF